jgi:membrane protease subunit HflK
VEAETRQLLQTILDSYSAGIEVTQLQLQRVDPPAEVIDAYRDVQAALADQARYRNEAETYRNSIIPAARGDAVQIEQQAAAYKLATVARAQGDAARFTSVYRAYKASQDVTTERLYLETMEEVLKDSHKVIIDKSAQGAGGVLPYLPLPALGVGQPAPTPAPGAGSGSPGTTASAATAPPAADTGASPPSGSGQQ